MAGTRFFQRINVIVQRCMRELWQITDLSNQEWASIRNEFANHCAYCDEACSGDPRTGLTPDHLEPNASGGELVRQNIIPACQACNDKRGKEDWRQFLLKQFPEAGQVRIAKIEAYRTANPYIAGTPESRLPTHLLEDFRQIETEWLSLLTKMRQFRDRVKEYRKTI